MAELPNPPRTHWQARWNVAAPSVFKRESVRMTCSAGAVVRPKRRLEF